jgi:RimJ/RimL family protein N-acetyltransferase
MLPCFETGRLLLRPRTIADYEACLDMDSDPGTMRYVGGQWEDPEAYGAYLRKRLGGSYPAGFGYWSIFAKTDPGRFLGWVVLIPHEEDASRIEIGWRLHRAARGRGFATEAASALVRYAFGTLGLERIVADIHPENLPSFRVAERIGMRFAGDGSYCGEPCKSFEMRRPAEVGGGAAQV